MSKARAAFLAAAQRLGAAWATPLKPEKWSPAEIAEHIAIA